MSASAPRARGLQNPATKFIKWRGGDDQGYFEYYDKTIEDKAKRNIKVDLTKGFLILDEDLFSVTGYIEPTKTGVVSNEVRDINDILTVKGYTPDGKNSILLKGSYTDLKETIRGSKIYHYTKSIYIMYEGVLCHLALTGASFASWLSGVQPNSNHGRCWIKHLETQSAKKGGVKYKVPVFEVGKEATDKEWEKVVELDANVLQPFLEQYLAKGTGPESEQTTTTQHEQIDTTKWREQATPSGIKLGEMTNAAIQELSELLVEEGKSETALYDYVGQALYDYQSAMKVWDQKADSSGRKLSDYSLDELKAVLAKIGMSHKYSIFIQAGIEAMVATMGPDESFVDAGDESDIPF